MDIIDDADKNRVVGIKSQVLKVMGLFGRISLAIDCVKMKPNTSFLATCRKLADVDDEHHTCCEKHMATDEAVDVLGEEWKGHEVRISDGNNRQGSSMKQGVLTHGRVYLLLIKGCSYRPRRTGERKGKSFHGCIVDTNLNVLNLVIKRKRLAGYSWT